MHTEAVMRPGMVRVQHISLRGLPLLLGDAWLLIGKESPPLFVALVGHQPSVKETRGEPACRLARAGVGVDSILPLSLSSPFSGLFLASSLGAFDNLISSIIGTYLSTLPQLLPGHEGEFFTLLTTLVPLPLDSNPGAG